VRNTGRTSSAWSRVLCSGLAFPCPGGVQFGARPAVGRPCEDGSFLGYPGAACVDLPFQAGADRGTCGCGPALPAGADEPMGGEVAARWAISRAGAVGHPGRQG
jgi:hypothetical protein